jgi:hypothetical protein
MEINSEKFDSTENRITNLILYSKNSSVAIVISLYSFINHVSVHNMDHNFYLSGFESVL